MLIFGKQLTRNRIVGNPAIFSLEERIFNTVCVISFITMCFEVPFNLVIGLWVPAALCAFGVFFAAYLYYISRFKRRCTTGIRLFCFVCNLLFVINYFYNSGIFGPNLLLFSLSFLLTVCLIPKTEFKKWIALNVITVTILLVVEYFYPQTAVNVYETELSKAIDFAVTYFVVVTLTYFAISYIRLNYDMERNAVNDKKLAIELQREALACLNTEKDKLFSIVAHDLRSPLNSIQGYLEILTEADLDDGERLKVEKELLQITRDTSDMLTNVVSWSKTQMEGVHAHMSLINVADLIVQALHVEKNVANKKGVALTIDCESDLFIQADRDMLHLVLRNLVNNAIKFTPNGGLVLVSASRKGEDAVILIKDNGLGIDFDRQEQLFKLKASSTYGTENEKGIGLGLLMCKEYTEMQGGHIWFESTKDMGSDFYLSFKLANQ